MKQFKVFFSWQADLPDNKTKRFIEDSIVYAKTKLDGSVELIPDEATRNRFGSPDIMESVFNKIDDCDLFIADVSIVGNYNSTNELEDEEAEKKYCPNPNVLLELGYAVDSKTWDRCICLANTSFGKIENLPFDLNHQRITGYSYPSDTPGARKNEMLRISEIIYETVLEYVDKPLPKKGFAHHVLGGYDIANNTIQNHIVPYNEHTLNAFNARSAKKVSEAQGIVDKISMIHLPLPQEDGKDIDEEIENLTGYDIKNNPLLAEKWARKNLGSHRASVHVAEMEQQIEKYMRIKLTDDFFDLGGLSISTFQIPHSSPSLYGTDQEKEKYKLLLDLEAKLFAIETREAFSQLFYDILIIPLAIKNISFKTDERIKINIRVKHGKAVKPTAEFFDPDYKGLEGCVYDDHLIDELLKLPEDGDIEHDSSLPAEAIQPYYPHIHTPVLDAFGYSIEPESDEQDYEQELQEYVQDLFEGSDNEYCFNIGALRPNETLWLDKVMLIRPIDGEIVLEYSLKSNNTTGEISGELRYTTRDE